MAQVNNRARLIHARNGYCEVMVRANIALSNHRPAKAISLYTEVLYKLSPANVCAFLNRSMAYIEEGYYELAVMDAYRACIAAKELRKNTGVAIRRLNQVVKYIRAERLHVDANHKWTSPEHRNIGSGWAMSPLASVVVNATPDVTGPNEARAQPFETSKPSIIRALEVRATYRLCGTLFKVGEGARMDALGLIDDAKSSMQINSWESRYFDKLGNDIMLQLLSEVDPWDPEDLRLLGNDTKDKRDERLTKVKDNMKAMASNFGYGDYPWDPYEPNLKKSRWQKRAKAWVQSRSDICYALIIQPEETDDTPAEGAKAYVELRANRDIKSGELVLSEHTITNLTTSIPEQVEAQRRAGISHQYYCNSCASLLAVPQQCPSQFQTPQTPVEPQENPSAGANMTTVPGQPSRVQSASSSPARSSPRQDFMFCRPNHMVPTCSAACRELGKDFDNGICLTRIEQRLRLSHFNDLKPRPMTDCKTQCLRDLIFLRLITTGINRGKSPLDINDLMFATSGPNMRDIENSEVESWSFVSHVVRPLRYLQQLFESTNTDQFFKLSQIDGWIINNLLVKINRAMRISKGPRYAKCFRADGMLDTAFGPGDERWEGLLNGIPKEHEDESVWVASIDSMLNMIRIADPAMGETPNVALVQREGVHVYAIQKAGEPAIKAGEPLLRSALGAEDGMEETRHGEEARSGHTGVFVDEVSADEEMEEAVDRKGQGGGEAMEVDGVGVSAS